MPYATVIILHGESENNLHYVKKLQVSPYKRHTPQHLTQVKFVLPLGKMCTNKNKGHYKWYDVGQKPDESESYSYLKELVEREVTKLDGRAERLYDVGSCQGSILAAMQALKTQYTQERKLIGGFCCRDTTLPTLMVEELVGETAEARYQRLEEIKNKMFIGIDCNK